MMFFRTRREINCCISMDKFKLQPFKAIGEKPPTSPAAESLLPIRRMIIINKLVNTIIETLIAELIIKIKNFEKNCFV